MVVEGRRIVGVGVVDVECKVDVAESSAPLKVASLRDVKRLAWHMARALKIHFTTEHFTSRIYH